MKFLSVDDEDMVRMVVVKTLEKAEPDSIIRQSGNPKEALDIIKNGFIPDIAFLDIEMFGMTGLELAKKIKDISSNTEIVFVTGYSQYALDAFAVHAHGYLLKPVELAKVKDEIRIIKEKWAATTIHPADLNPPEYPPNKRCVTCFGNFDARVNGVPLVFSRQKAKELLAYLVNKRGSPSTTKEISAILFGDRAYTHSLLNQTQTVIATLQKTLKDAGITDVVEKKFNSIAIIPSQIDCDFYRFLNGDIEAVNSYSGEYMANYEWADMTAGWLSHTSKEKHSSKEQHVSNE